MDSFATSSTQARPRSLASLCAATGFTVTEVKRLYRTFKQECPSGQVGSRLPAVMLYPLMQITEETFHSIFSKFFPLGAESYNGLACTAL